MRSVYKPVCACLLMLIAAVSSFAQLPDLKFRHQDVRNGLPSNSVNVIVKDSLGYMWIGTKNGLCRYDGYSYTVFQHSYQNSRSLPDNNVISLLVTPNNQLWISTGKGICCYDRLTGQFNPLSLPAYLPQKNSTATKIFLLDKKGYIWFDEFLYQSLVGYNPVTGDYQVLDFFNNDGDKGVINLYEDKKGYFWISRYTAIYYYNTLTKTYEKIHNLSDKKPYFPNLITAFTEAADGSMWLTSWGAGLEHFTPATRHTDDYLVEPTPQLSGTKNVVNSPVWIKDRLTGKTNLWLMSEYGALCFDTLSHKFRIYHPDIYDPYANKINFAVSQFPGSYFDRKQNMLWCWGPFGIDICDFNIQTIQTFRTSTQTNNIHTGSIDGFINNTSNNNEYFLSCFTKNSLLVYNEVTRSIQAKSFPITGGIPVIFQPAENRIWMSSGHGVWEWDRQRNALKNITKQLGIQQDEKARNYRINCYFKDSRGIVWLGSNGGGFCRYNLTTATAEWTNHIQQKNGITIPSPGTIMQFANTLNGSIYMLDRYKGLFEISPDGRVIDLYSPGAIFNTTSHQKIAPFSLNNMAYDKKELVWICSDAGLLTFNIHTHAFAVGDGGHQLPEGVPENVAVDKYGHVWLSYFDQLVVFDPNRHLVRLFNYRNGYEGSPDGCNFLINNKQELRIAYPDHIESIAGDPFDKMVSKIPGVLLTRVASGGKSVPADNLYNGKHFVAVSYKNNNLELEYALPLYHNPDELMYSYRLEGYDRSWINSGSFRTAKYTNLPGGNYNFQVRAFDPGSGMYSAITSLPVIVYPPFWKTWWFITLIVLLFLSLSYLLYRYRLDQLLRLERMRVAISTDLHDEVGATLSSISIYSNVARQLANVNGEESKKYLERIEVSSIEKIEIMSDIVWSINPANDDPGKIVQRMRLYAYEILGAAGINLDWQDHQILNIHKMNMDQRKNFYLIFKEGINNVSKYARATDVFVEIKTVNRLLSLQISDNGIGFDPDADHCGNGLKNMHLRSRLLKGELKLRSSPGNGTQVTLLFPVS